MRRSDGVRGDETRGKEIAKTLRMLAAMMRGEALDKDAAAKYSEMNPEPALRNLKLLGEHIPGVKLDSSGRRHVYRFEVADLLGADYPEGKVTTAAAIAMSLGAAFGKVLTGSEYHTEFLKLRRSFVERLASCWKQQFADMSRKFVVFGGREELLEDKGEILDEVLDAILKERHLRIEYENFRGDARVRTIEPYSLVVYDGHLYVVARDTADGEQRVRTFRFARIRTADVLKQGFPYPAPNEYDPDVLRRDSMGIWLATDAPLTVRVRLSQDWAVYARHHRWHESQRVVREHEDGSLELELRVRLCPELEKWVLGFGEGAEVLEPEELRQTIAERLRAAAARYTAEDAVQSA